MYSKGITWENEMSWYNRVTRSMGKKVSTVQAWYPIIMVYNIP